MAIHNNISDRMALSRLCFIQISALPTFDGCHWIEAVQF